MVGTHTMEIFLADGGWMVKDNDPETVRLFNTDTLPTPFLVGTPAAKVIDVLQHLNPDAIVKERNP